MYCGDETAAIVGDLGTSGFRFGFAGEDMPKGDLSSCVGLKLAQKKDALDLSKGKKSITASTGKTDSSSSTQPDSKKFIHGAAALNTNKLGTEIVYPLKDGLYDRFDVIEAQWEYAISHELYCKPEEHPILMCDSSFNTLEIREKMLEMMFEKIKAPLTFIAPNAMLSAFSVGRATALIVDVGASGSRVVPVNDGYLIRKSLKRSRIGGNVVDSHLTKLVEETLVKRKIRCPCQFSKKRLKDDTLKVVDAPYSVSSKIHPSLLNWQKQCIVQDMKQTVCRVWSELNFDREMASAYMDETYILPDGTKISIGADRFVSPELMIDPNIDSKFLTKILNVKDSNSLSSNALPAMIRDSIQSAHVDLRKELVQQILVVGGGSLLPGTIERLGKEVGQMLPKALKNRFLTPTNYQRKYSVWTGGSILSCLGSFQQMWLSKAEYDEYGAKSLLISRCTN